MLRLLVLALMLMETVLVQAQPRAWLMASDGDQYDEFGEAVAISGDYVAVGASRAANLPSGAVYLFKRQENQWREVAKLTPSDAEARDGFGAALAMSGDVLLVGARGKDDGPHRPNHGAAYVFRRQGDVWNEEAKLVASDGYTGDFFGGSVFINGEYAIVGAREDDYNTGAAYVFRHEDGQWFDEGKLTSPPSIPTTYFGTTIAISAPYALVTGYYSGTNEQTLQVFHREAGTWNRDLPLTLPEDPFVGRFTAALDGDYLLVGTYPEIGWDGAALIYRQEQGHWMQQARLGPHGHGEHGWRYGSAVALSGAYAIVGNSAEQISRGAAYVYRRDGEHWHEIAKLTPPDTVASNGYPVSRFGQDVATDGKHVVVSTDATGAFVYALDDYPTPREPSAATPRNARARFAPNHPNPFAGSTTLTFTLPEATPVRLTVIDMQGRRVGTLLNRVLAAGAHSVVLDARHLPGGVYVCRLQTKHSVETQLVTRLP